MDDHLSPFERLPTDIFLHIKDIVVQGQNDSIVSHRRHKWISKDRNSVHYIRTSRAFLAFRLISRRLNAIFTPYAVCEVDFEWTISLSKDMHVKVYQQFKKVDPLVEPAPEAFVQSISSLGVFFDIRISETTDQAMQDSVNRLSAFWDEVQRYTSLTCLAVRWDLDFSQHRSFLPPVDKLLQTVHRTTGGRLSRLLLSPPIPPQLDQPPLQILQPTFLIEHLALDHCWNRQIPQPYLTNLAIRMPGLRSFSVNAFPSTARFQDLFPPTLDTPTLEESLKKLILIPPFGLSPVIPTRNLDLLWYALKHSGACLTKLHICYGISNALMQYLASYTGVRILNFGLDSELAPEAKPPSPHIFPRGILPRHAASLTSLTFHRGRFLPWVFEAGLTLDTSTWPTPLSFRKLVRLNVLVGMVVFNAQHVQRLFDYVTNIPILEVFIVSWTIPPSDYKADSQYLESRLSGPELGEVSVMRGRLRYINIKIYSIHPETSLTNRCLCLHWEYPLMVSEGKAPLKLSGFLGWKDQ
ncbi:hypothetical protein AX16_006822 [Volvariella volvacea WC 439]|nr:hypothetical protein AX16_006822 [Volvariella volvacea WC 439]